MIALGACALLLALGVGCWCVVGMTPKETPMFIDGSVALLGTAVILLAVVRLIHLAFTG